MCVTVNVHMPKDRITLSHQGYGFVEFMSEDDADYAMKVMNMIKLYGKPIRVNKVWVVSSYLVTCRLFEFNIVRKFMEKFSGFLGCCSPEKFGYWRQCLHWKSRS
jgi:RNA recognition motif-containing protein